jgi:CheY-like chemotaxis protein
MKILAVDDDPLILELLEATLKLNGDVQLTTAQSAIEAAELIANSASMFDCFLLDIVMPEVSGIELTQWIRKLPHYQSTPILMITAMSSKAHIDAAFRAGASDYVTKPLDQIEVTTRVLLAERQANAARQMRSKQALMKSAADMADDLARPTLAQPLPLDDVDGMIEYGALQNYLKQLGRGAFYATGVVAIRIMDAGDVYARCTGGLFRDVLADVADCIMRSMGGADFIMSYAGNGIFTCVVSHPELLDLQEIGLMMDMQIEQLELTDSAHRPLAISMTIGEPRAIGMMNSGVGAVNTLRQAVEAVAWGAKATVDPARKKQSGADRLIKALVEAF